MSNNTLNEMKKNTKDAYDALSEQAENRIKLWKTNPYDRSLYETELQLVRRHTSSAGTVIELGCGWDPYTEILKEVHRLIAIDFSMASLQNIQTSYKNLSLICADVNYIPVRQNSADMVIATDELICCDTVNPKQMLSEISSVLRPGGILIIEYDTKWCFDSLWMLFDSYIGNQIGYEVTKAEITKLFTSLGGGMITWGFPESEEKTQVRFFTHKEMYKLLREANFQIVKQRGILILAGLIPTVVQQRTDNKFLLSAANFLAKLDRWAGELPILRSLGGDTLILAQKKRELK